MGPIKNVGTSIYLANILSYVQRIELGHSNQMWTFTSADVRRLLKNLSPESVGMGATATIKNFGTPFPYFCNQLS